MRDRASLSASDMESNPTDAALSADEASPRDPRVSIHVHSIRARLCDADGISAKAAIDGIVAAGLLKDDSPKHVKEVTFSQEKGKVEKTVITIKRVGAV